jgi:hypothetical protein
MIADIIRGYSKFVLYGAQVVAYGAYVATKRLSGRVPERFVVSDLDGNPARIEGLPVGTLDAVSRDTLIVVAVTELLQDEIAATLQANGYRHIFKLTAHEEHLLMSAYYTDIGRFPPAARRLDRCGDDYSDNAGGGNDGFFALYEVRHHLDKPLRNRPEPMPWEIAIQAGAALTDARICAQPDNKGDNISDKNKQYCEATAMYSIWKNASTDWVGIEQYRRHLLVTPDMLSDDIDVILPLPYICYPNAESQFRRFVGEEIALALHKALRALYPDKYETYARCLNGKYHCAYNLIVAKKAVFGKFCEWAFRITSHIEAQALQSVKETRALAYTVEQLTSIYFIANLDNLTIRHAEKAIYA